MYSVSRNACGNDITVNMGSFFTEPEEEVGGVCGFSFGVG